MIELRSEAVPLRGEGGAVPSAPAWLTDARNVVSGLLFTAFVAVIGTALLALLLVVGVVASPLIAAVVAYAIVRHRRAARARPALRAA